MIVRSTLAIALVSIVFHNRSQPFFKSIKSIITMTSSDTNASEKKRKYAPNSPFRRNKMVLLGDSITQMSFSAELSGWGTHLADVYQRRCDVYNRGFSGYNSDWFLKYLETEEGKYDVFDSFTANGIGDGSSDVKLVTIFFGANDASCEKLNARSHVPVPRFKTNLKDLVDLCRQNFGDRVRIIFITPPPVHHASRLKYQVQRYGDKATGDLERNLDLASQYTDAVVETAKELDYPCLNIFKAMQEALPGDNEEWSAFLSDGLHFSARGNLFVGKKLKELIDEVYPEIAVTPCPHTAFTGNSSSKGGAALGSEKGVGPWHDEIDHLEVDKAFETHLNAKKAKA
jgi:lysophospholipase L1-like esterase